MLRALPKKEKPSGIKLLALGKEKMCIGVTWECSLQSRRHFFSWSSGGKPELRVLV